jgi:hypothetical protein
MTGLQGDYRGTCIVCLEPTDTGLAVRGEPEAAMAVLMVLGVPGDQAAAVLPQALGCAPGMVPDGEVTVPFRVCARCAARLPGARVGLILAGAELPTVRVPAG